MNNYGRIANDHWRRWLPTRYAEILDPEAYFSTLGMTVEAQVFELEDQLAGSDPANEGYLEKVARLRSARSRAEEMVLADLVYLEPEPQTQEPDEDPDESMQSLIHFQRLQAEIHAESGWDDDPAPAGPTLTGPRSGR